MRKVLPGIIHAPATLVWALLMFCLAGFSTVQANPPEGNWTEKYSDGMGQAKAQGKPVLLMFSASWCGPCNRMKQEVFTKASVKQALKDWVPIYIDGDKQKNLMDQYKVEAFPTFVLLSPSGKETGRFVGGVGPETFLDNLRIMSADLPRVEKQLAASPKDPYLWDKKAKLLEAIGNIPEAVDAYKKANSLDPQNKTGAAIDVAFFEAARMDQNGPSGVDRRFYDFINRYPNSPRAEDALFNRARIAFDDKRFDDTKKILQAYKKRYPSGKYTKEAEGILDYIAKGGPGTQPGTQPETQPAPQGGAS